MYRLNKRAYEILCAEIQVCAGSDQIGKAEKQIVIKRLEKMRLEQGSPATLDELRDAVIDVYPQFNEKVLRLAASSNQPPSAFSKALGQITWTAIFLSIPVALVWFVNLPFPMIRKPVAEKAPILLLPSFLAMDRGYRGAISSLEQAEQLINKATSPADIELGAKKAEEAQKHLDNLPVWFLGYYPQAYCGLFGCTWKFTFDEFEQARQRVAKLQAIAFQDKNALTPLKEAEIELVKAKQQYEQASNVKDREKIIALWQTAIDQLEQIPQQTLAGETAQTKLKAYKRDFENARIGTFIAAAAEFDLEAEKVKQKQPQAASELWEQAISRLNKIPQENPRYLEAQRLLAAYQVKVKTVIDPRSGSYIEAAKQFAFAAAKESQNPPHPVAKWEQIEKLWQKAIDHLENIRVDEPNYVEAQKLSAQYVTNLGIVETRREAERQAEEILKQAKEETQQLISNPPSDTQQLRGQIQGIVNQLRSVKAGTTAYAEAQQLLVSAQNRLKQ
jgi:hypothetical protein